MITTQEEFLQEVLRLKKANPEMDIHFCVSSEELIEECSWTDHKISGVEISPWYRRKDDRILTDIDEIYDYFYDQIKERYPNYTDAEMEVEFESRTIPKAICVFTCGA